MNCWQRLNSRFLKLHQLDLLPLRVRRAGQCHVNVYMEALLRVISSDADADFSILEL